jgi:cell division protein FtsB
VDRPARRPRRQFALLRWLGVAVVCAIAVAYVQPIRAYFDAKADVASHRAERAALVAKRAKLNRRLALAGTDDFIEREARRLGFVRPGERLFIIQGLETWKRTHVP